MSTVSNSVEQCQQCQQFQELQRGATSISDGIFSVCTWLPFCFLHFFHLCFCCLLSFCGFNCRPFYRTQSMPGLVPDSVTHLLLFWRLWLMMLPTQKLLVLQAVTFGKHSPLGSIMALTMFFAVIFFVLYAQVSLCFVHCFPLLPFALGCFTMFLFNIFVAKSYCPSAIICLFFRGSASFCCFVSLYHFIVESCVQFVFILYANEGVGCSL